MKKEDFDICFGATIRHVRTQRTKISQRELSRILEMSPPMANVMEQGLSAVSTWQLFLIEEAFLREGALTRHGQILEVTSKAMFLFSDPAIGFENAVYTAITQILPSLKDSR